MAKSDFIEVKKGVFVLRETTYQSLNKMNAETLKSLKIKKRIK